MLMLLPVRTTSAARPPRPFRFPSALAVGATALGAAVLGACGGDTPTATTPQPPRGIVVLDGYIQPGLTFLGDTGSTTTALPFGPSTEFDAGGLRLERDTVLAVSSRDAGDLLYLADVARATVRRLQLPARSNPGSARLFRGSNGASLVAVALRDSSGVALVSVTGSGTPTITRIGNAGACPTDMFQYDNATWIVDANATCRTNYAVQGDVRLIRVPTTGTTRDTLVIPGVRGSDASVLLSGEVAFVAAGGVLSPSYELLSSGAVAKVDLKSRRVVQTRPLPAGTYGAGAKLGLDGFLYVSLYETPSYESRILKVRLDDLSFVSNGTTPWLRLTGASGAAVSCGSGQADALGRLHCITTDYAKASATTLLVFSPGFVETRRTPARQGGVDLALR